MYRNDFYYLDWTLKKTVISEITPSFLYNDFGVFFDDYKLQNANFNPTQITNDVGTRTIENVFFKYDVAFSFKAEKYYLRNQKLNDILSNFGGMINFLFKIGSFLCLYINNFFLTKDLLKFACNFNSKKVNKKQTVQNLFLKYFIFPQFFKKKTFFSKENLDQNQKKSSQIIDYLKNNSNFPSIKSILFRNKDKEEYLYKRSLIQLYEYIDLIAIVKKLGDIDKLKHILFNDYQRFFFDLIPKANLDKESMDPIKTNKISSNNEREKEIFIFDHEFLEKFENLKI